MQPFRQLQQCGSIAARCSGKHDRKARHEEGRAQCVPSLWIGLVPCAQIRKALFQVPIHLCRKVTVRASTGSLCRLYVHARTDGFRKRVECCEVTGITPTQPGKALLAQAGATRPSGVGQTHATGITGKRDQEILK
ncbi:MAG: hypothetical protein ACT4UQ_07625 [Gammaproteobacteria bacterium]